MTQKKEGVFCPLNDLLILSGFCVCFAFYFFFIAHCTIVVFSTHFLQGIRDFSSPFLQKKPRREERYLTPIFLSSSIFRFPLEVDSPSCVKFFLSSTSYVRFFISWSRNHRGREEKPLQLESEPWAANHTHCFTALGYLSHTLENTQKLLSHTPTVFCTLSTFSIFSSPCN